MIPPSHNDNDERPDLLTSALPSELCTAGVLHLLAHIRALPSSATAERDGTETVSDGYLGTSAIRFDEPATQSNDMHLTAPDINSAGGLSSRPIASRAVSKLNTASMDAIASQTEESAS